MMKGSKELNDTLTDFVVTKVASSTDGFMPRYLKSASKIAEYLQVAINFLHKNNSDKDNNLSSYKNVYSKQDIKHSRIADKVYLTGGTSADFHGGGIDEIKPSDLDYSVSISNNLYDFILSNNITFRKVLSYVSGLITNELKWFASNFPTDFKELYDLLDLDNQFMLYNSYTSKPIINGDIRNINFGKIDSKIDYSHGEIYDGLMLIRFYWYSMIKSENGFNQHKCRINIVDLSIHRYDPSRVFILPLLNTYRFLDDVYITTKTPEAIFNDQLMTYAGSIFRSSLKLTKRQNRLKRLILKLNLKDTQIQLCKPDKTFKFCKDNIIIIKNRILKSKDIYPYLVLSFLDNMNSTEIDLNITCAEYKPQLGTLMYEFIDCQDIGKTIVDNIRKTLNDNIFVVRGIINYISDMYNIDNCSEIKAGDIYLPKEIPIKELIHFVRTPDMWKKIVLQKDFNLWEMLSDKSDLVLELHLNDYHYKIYNEYMKRFKK